MNQHGEEKIVAISTKSEKHIDKPMPAVGKTFVFPREDNMYMKKESIAYDEAHTKIWRERPRRNQKEKLKEWLAYGLVGVFLGMTAFVMVTIEENLTGAIARTVNRMIKKAVSDANAAGTAHFDIAATEGINPWLVFGFCSGGLGIIAGTMTTYWGQGAAGSGVAEMIGYLNGVNYPGFIGIPTYITKTFAVVFSVVGRLCVGKEGPLAHIGSNVGVMVLYIPKMGFEFMQNPEKRRQFVAAGGSAGVSVAFGAPVGGTLFAYEMSRPNTFWRFSMIWKVFLSCSLTCFFLALFSNVAKGNFYGDWSGSALKFGSLALTKDVNAIFLLPAAIIIGIVGGCLGALFINVNTRMAGLRKRCLKTKWIKPLETFCWCFATASFFFWMPYAVRPCSPVDVLTDDQNHMIINITADAIAEKKNDLYQSWCPNLTGQDAQFPTTITSCTNNNTVVARVNGTILDPLPPTNGGCY